jgi:phenolic acid decarboxylase
MAGIRKEPVMTTTRARIPTQDLVPEFAEITLFEEVGENNEDVIDVGPGQLPEGWADRRN